MTEPTDRTRSHGSAATAASSRVMPPIPGVAALAALLLLGAACDDQVKYVDTFDTMTEQPAFQTYEAPPRPPVEGTVPVGGSPPAYTIQEADTALSSPLQPTARNIERGGRLYRDFCLPCHGPEGEGDGPVVNTTGEHPGRFPALPGADLTADRAQGLSDGYIWGVLENGFSIMPSYERIPREDRWFIVEYVRFLQQEAVAGRGADRDEREGAESAEEL